MGNRLGRCVHPEDATGFLGGVVIDEVEAARDDSMFAELPAGICIRPAG